MKTAANAAALTCSWKFYVPDGNADLFFGTALQVGYGKPWFSNTRLFYKNCFQLPCLLPRDETLGAVYQMQLGFYIQAAVSLFHWEVRNGSSFDRHVFYQLRRPSAANFSMLLFQAKRKDRVAMIIHHIATIGLLAYSDYVNLVS